MSSIIYKIFDPYVVALYKWTPIVERYVTRVVVKIEHQKDTYHTEIELCA